MTQRAKSVIFLRCLDVLAHVIWEDGSIVHTRESRIVVVPEAYQQDSVGQSPRRACAPNSTKRVLVESNKKHRKFHEVAVNLQ
jgi:hypothetical protein